MKTRFTTIDLKTALAEIVNSDAIGLRLINVYDIDNKTYLIRVSHGDKKIVILIESGNRVHLTEYDWPKNMLPSAFSMKCRKHLKGRRLSSVKQLGVDRIVDFQFGYDEAAYHLIVELYDRGNIILTDCDYSILQLLRMRTDTDKDVKFAVREQYPWNLARQYEPVLTKEQLKERLQAVKDGEQLKRALNPMFIYGPALLEHSLLEVGLQPNVKINHQFLLDNDQDMEKLYQAINIAESIILSINSNEVKNGYVIQKRDCVKSKPTEEPPDEYLSNVEFHPFLYNQHKNNQLYVQFPSFNKAVDEFFSKLESQKIDMKALQQEKSALKRLENVKQDHEKRIQALQCNQDEVTNKAELIEVNLPLVEQAIVTINSAIANQIDWEEIEEIVDEAKSQNDPVARLIKSLQLSINKITLMLNDPFVNEYCASDENDSDDEEVNNIKSKEDIKNKKNKDNMVCVEIDLSLTAFANARSYHDRRRQAASKEQKTMQASKKALKSAEQKTQETLKEVQTSKMINKTRKTYWFEKFFWFVSSENYLVIGGRDQQQNELIVKRYLRPGDLYIHADLHGASSVILKNPNGGEVPPKTLNEAGTMAICYSAAWEARVITSAWWVYHHQVSKTAPSGEYLSTGSFMIRGKKNYLPPSYLIMGFSILFKLDESCICNHMNDRKVRSIEDASVNKDAIQAEEESIKDEELNIDEELDEKNNDSENENHIDKLIERSTEVEKDIDTCDQFESVTEILEIDNLTNESLTGGPSTGGPPSDGQSSDGQASNGPTTNELLTDRPTTDGPTTDGQPENTLEEIEHTDGDSFYPDTSIQLQHISGDTFQLHRGVSSASANACDEEEGIDGEHFVYLGDNEKMSTTKQESQTRGPRLSAKQKRDLKKKNRSKTDKELDINNAKETSVKKEPATTRSEQPAANEPPLKRGQKSKQKRMKDKYKHQDEEDKEMMQQILRANEPERPPKKKGKEKQKEKQQNKQKPKKQINLDKIPDILHQPDQVQSFTDTKPPVATLEDEDDIVTDDKENINVLDSLTGCPLPEDTLLYAVPICAPYSCMQNYKYKVKLTPGTGKKGKAAKSAVHMFQVSKDTSSWEKDLLKNLKDVDISRNIPGKVKASAPNLMKAKKK